jgi:hypothetical protein
VRLSAESRYAGFAEVSIWIYFLPNQNHPIKTATGKIHPYFPQAGLVE